MEMFGSFDSSYLFVHTLKGDIYIYIYIYVKYSIS